MAYEFHYTPTGTGVISGKEVLEQTEDAINDLGNTAISGVQEALDKAEQALTNSQNAVDDAQTALNTANNAEGVAIQAQTDVGNLSGTVTNIGNRVTTAEGNITNLQGRMTTAEGNVTNLQGRMTTAEGNIGNLQTAVSTAQATANSAQQTANTARQQSYVFRYSSTALTPSSTNSNTLLDNTDNLKVGDKVIDSSGVLFSVTAIDTQNSTFTIGTALIDLAQDSDVVHKSGDETVLGQKIFDDINTISTIAEIGSTAGVRSFKFLDKNKKTISRLDGGTFSSGMAYSYWLVNNGSDVFNGVSLYQTSSSLAQLRPYSSTLSMQLGASNRYFSDCYTSKINSLTPSSLSLPVIDRTKYVDISGYFTNTGNGDINTYSVTANGWIYLRLTDIGGCQLSVLDSSNNRLYGSTSTGNLEQLCLPVTAGTVIETQWTTSTSVTVAIARFIPCQGNV